LWFDHHPANGRSRRDLATDICLSEGPLTTHCGLSPHSSKLGMRACPHSCPSTRGGELGQGRVRAAHQRCLDPLDQDGAEPRHSGAAYADCGRRSAVGKIFRSHLIK
jgi:hypothetical protein